MKYSFPESSPETVVFFDLVASKLNHKKAEPISISAIRVNAEEGIVDSFHSLLRPKTLLSEEMEDISGYDNETLSRVQSSHIQLMALVEFLGEDLVVTSDPDFNFKVLIPALQRNKIPQPSQETLHLNAALQRVLGKAQFDVFQEQDVSELAENNTDLKSVSKLLEGYLKLNSDNFYVDENVYSIMEWHYD